MSILQEAHNLVTSQRAAEHGSFTDNATTALTIYHAAFNPHNDGLVTQDVAALLFCLKLARHKSNPGNRDNLVDAAGYLELYAQQVQPEGATERLRALLFNEQTHKEFADAYKDYLERGAINDTTR